MKKGKVSQAVLGRSVIKLIENRNSKVISGAVYGRDCAVIDGGDNYVLTSTEAALSGNMLSFYYAVIKAAHNIAAAGGTPVSASLALILNEDITEPRLKEVTRTVLAACKECGIELSGGHTEVTSSSRENLATVTVTGLCKKADYHYPRQAKPDMDIVLVGNIAMEETAYLLEQNEEQLAKKLPKAYIERAKQFTPGVCPKDHYHVEGTGAYLGDVVSFAYDRGAVMMHDLSEGGIFGALWELTAGTGLGLVADVRKISIRQETVEFCEITEINPYEAPSCSAMLIITEDGEKLVEKINSVFGDRLPSSWIGKLTASKDKKLINGDEVRFLNRS